MAEGHDPRDIRHPHRREKSAVLPIVESDSPQRKYLLEHAIMNQKLIVAALAGAVLLTAAIGGFLGSFGARRPSERTSERRPETGRYSVFNGEYRLLGTNPDGSQKEQMIRGLLKVDSVTGQVWEYYESVSLEKGNAYTQNGWRELTFDQYKPAKSK